MKILIKNCNLISMSEWRDKYEKNIDILIKEGKICKIEKNINQQCDKVINASGKVVMPGLINTHSHISMSIFRETVDGLKTQDWLEKKIWPIEDKLTSNDIYWGAMLSCVEMIKSGTTTVNDMYFFTKDIIKAAIETKIRMQTTRTLMGRTKEDEQRIKQLEELINKYNEETVSFNVGIHGLYTSSRQYVQKCVQFAKQNNLPIHMHFCENEQERKDIKTNYNVENPAQIIKEDFGKIHNILAHCVKIDDEDVKILKNTNTYISHCPISNLKLGCGIAPISKLIKEGICVSLGTDGQGSGSNLDMFETMKFAALLQKGISQNPKLLPAYEVLKMATINGAKALGLEEKIGSIDNEKQADIIIINLDSCQTMPLNNIFAQIVYNVKGYNVDTTIVNGKILMENRMLNNIDEEKIINNCNKILM